MKIDTTIDGNQMTLALEGKLDTITSPDLEKIIQNDLEEITDLTLDLANLTYISSAGLRVCLAAQKRMTELKGTFTIVNAGPKIMEVFEITGFTDIIKFA